MMNKINILFICILLFTCSDAKFYSQQPANPPVGVEIIGLEVGDYLLIFRSGNDSNPRFRGFYIFIHTSRAELLQMDSEDEADYILDEVIDGIDYNPIIDNPILILFSDEESYESTITIDGSDYTVTKRLPKDRIVISSWLTLRTFLYDEKDGITVSTPGNSVYIE